MQLGGTLDLQVDPVEADRRKRARLVRLNTRVIPRLRLIGFVFVAAAALLHNTFIYPGLDAFSWPSWLRLVAILGVYSLVTWYLLYLFYEDARPAVDLGTVFLGCDMSMFSAAIYFTGAERSWLFFLPLFRVIDQTGTSFRRALVFAHLAPLSYAVVIVHAILVQHRQIPVAPELAKVIFIYIGSLYVAMIARTGAERHQRTSEVIRLARGLIHELEEKSNALELSSQQLHDALDQQADLHKENARLFAATEAREARLSQILHATSDGIIFVGPDGRIEAANVRAGELLGFDPQTVIGIDVNKILARLYSLGDGDAFGVTLEALLADPRDGGRGDLQQPSTGRVFHWVAQPTRDTGGSTGTAGLTFTFQDVTPTRDLVRQLQDKSRLLEDARRRAEEANRAKGEFLANVTHEVRAPLSAMIDTAQILLDAPPSQDRPEMIGRIKSSAESLLAIIRDILDFSKIDSRSLTLDNEPLQLRGLTQDVLDSLQVTAGEKGLTLALDVNTGVPDDLLGDALRLRQILVNLIGNAVKFTQSGDIRVRVDVASRLPGEVCLHFAVIDTGIGIPRDKQELVFEAFAQDDTSPRHFGGPGLGLSISARLVELMGGDIWVESEVGRGSAFRFTANFGVQGTGRPIRSSDADSAIRSIDVLVVDDEPVRCELVAQLLRTRGHRVVAARDGREALVELARHPVQIALIDLQMPGMNGLQLAATIRTWERAHGGHLPLVAMTASVVSNDLEQCHAAGIDETLIKPIARERLYRIVESLASDAGLPVRPPPELAGRAEFLEGLGNDTVVARRLIDLFVQDSGTLVREIGRAIADRDADRLRRASHALKGSVSNFPLGAARDTATRMERIGFDADFDAARDMFPVLEQEVDRLRGVLPTLI